LFFFGIQLRKWHAAVLDLAIEFWIQAAGKIFAAVHLSIEGVLDLGPE